MKLTPVHEAGHAVAAMLGRLAFDIVTVVPGDGSAGFIAHASDRSVSDLVAVLAAQPDPILQRRYAERHLIAMLAGAAAVLTWAETPLSCGWPGDEDAEARDLAALLDPVHTEAVLAGHWYFTRWLFQRPRVWRATAHVALALLDHRTLTGAQARAIAAAHLGPDLDLFRDVEPLWRAA